MTDFGELQSDRRLRPAVNVQLAVDADSRAVAGVDVSDAAAAAGVTRFVPPPAPRDPAKHDTRYQPKPTDSAARVASACKRFTLSKLAEVHDCGHAARAIVIAPRVARAAGTE